MRFEGIKRFNLLDDVLKESSKINNYLWSNLK